MRLHGADVAGCDDSPPPERHEGPPIAVALRIQRRECDARAARQVAAQAPNAHRSGALGLVYDEICRRTWAERSRAGDDSLDIETVVATIDVTLLGEAEAAYDRESQERSAPRGGKGAKGGGKSGKDSGKGAKGGGKGKFLPVPRAAPNDRGDYGEPRAKRARHHER